MAYVLLFGWSMLAVCLASASVALRRPMGLAVAATLVVFTGMRAYSIDYGGYQIMFELMVNLDLDYPERLFFGKDVLFGALMDGLYRIGADYQAVFLASALLSVGIKQVAFARAFGGNTALPWLVALCLSFFLHDFTQIRIAIALALCFVALQHLLAGRRRPWVWLTVLAAGFHLSAAVFLPISAFLLLRPERRAAGWAVVTAGMALSILGLFQVIGSVDARLLDHADVTGLNWTALAVGTFKLALLTAMALALRQHANPRFELASRMVWPSVMFAATGLVLLFALSGAASALAFRLYEFFDAFAVWVVASALLERNPLSRVLALGYCAFGVVLQLLPGLFTPYEMARFSSLFG